MTKPLKWIGTQRTPYTHRKTTQKKIKVLLGKLREAKVKYDENKKEKNTAVAENVKMEVDQQEEL